MAERKKKSIYSKKLKDINKDGKRNFKDTFLGDLIGADGKIGVKKGRPGLRASLKGARREDGKPDSTAKEVQKTKRAGQKTKKVTLTSRLDKKGTTPKKKVTPTSRLDKKGATPKKKVTLTPRLDSKQSTGLSISYKQWQNMTRQEREARGLPVSVIGGELGFNRFMTGVTGKAYRLKSGTGNRVPTSPAKPKTATPTLGSARRRSRTGAAKGGMMAKKAKK